ncbi:MAG TPA: hypothetical protein VGI55_14575 [Solirubrobacteraceae bacterium]
MSDPSQQEALGRVRAAAERVLRANWREGHRASDGVPYAFTCPATPRYRHQWYWDSCFHAIAWRHIDPGRAREELRTLLRAGRLDGFIPHTAFWDRPAYWRRAPFYGTHTVFGCSATATIQTPLLALAWELVAGASPDDPAFATEALSQLRLHYDWLAEHRDPDRDGLLTIIQPDESGLDDSPKYDACYRWMRHDRPGHFWLIERYRRLSYDAATIAARYEEHVEDVVVNVFYALALRALARLCALDPESPDGGVYLERADETERALLERCHDPDSGLFFDLAGSVERPLRVSTWSSLAPLALTGIPEDVRRRLVEEHLLDARRYRAAFGIPSVSMEERSFRPGFQIWRCWRGPSWMNTSWLLVPAIRELGYAQDADRITESMLLAVDRHGLREYYNPLTGVGLAARGFAFSALILDLLPDSEIGPQSGNCGLDGARPSADARIMST